MHFASTLDYAEASEDILPVQGTTCGSIARAGSLFEVLLNFASKDGRMTHML